MMRPPHVVMDPARAAAVVPTALCFPRATMRELVRDRYRIDKLRFVLDTRGRGEVLYRLTGGGATFHFFLVSDELPEERKTDRNYAQSWDAMGVLCEGEWTAEREARLRREVPKQRAGYADYDTLVYARGNRSKRVFDHVVDSLAAGRQPDLSLIAPIGYILRTTAFIGNGALGTRAFAGLPRDHPLRRPYHVQFCSAFVLREFVFDLVDHLARAASPRAVRLAPAYRRYLGLGNAAATGLAAFVANHPHLMHRWTQAGEEALAQATARAIDASSRERFLALLDKAIRYHEEAAHDGDGVFAPPQIVAADLALLRDARPLASWQAMREWAQSHLRADACEVANAILLDVYPGIAIAFADAFEAEERFEIDPAMPVRELRDALATAYGWALELAAGDGANHYFWYRPSTAPRDVRRGVRGRAADLEAETSMDGAMQVRALADELARSSDDTTTAAVVSRRADLRHVVARVQSLAACGYAELRQAMLASDFSPFATVRYPLSFFGMEKFEAAMPKSVRGVFMQGAPIAEDVAAGRDGDWPFPLLPDPHARDDEAELAPLPDADTRYQALSSAGAEPAMRIAPDELARMIYTALQGHGMPLGVAEGAAKLVAFAYARGEPALAPVLRDCATPGACRGEVAWQQVTPQLAVADAGGASVIGCAPSACDLAIAAAAATGFGASLVLQARDAWLAQAVTLRAARHGFAAFAIWRDGWAAGGPSPDGPWFARGAGEGIASEALLIACSRPDSAATSRAAGASEIAQLEGDWQRFGLVITREDFDALALAGRALLLPAEQESRVLDPGVDPLKTF